VNQVELARRLEISCRSLRNWKKFAMEGDFPKVGRPSLDSKSRADIKLKIKNEWSSQGRPGWRAVKAALPSLPTREIQSCLKELNEEARSCYFKMKRKNSARVEVKKANAVWAQDTTFTEGRKGAVEVIKDRGSLGLICAEPVEGPDSKSLVEVLKKAHKKHDLPLVLMTDNGSGYKSECFESYLRMNKIVHLKSLPRCPQHNGSVERGIREFKKVLKQTKDIQEGLNILNTQRRHGSKNYQTSEEILLCDKMKISDELRNKFYVNYVNNLSRLKVEIPSLRKRKLAERKMVFDMLENLGLIKQTTGSLKL